MESVIIFHFGEDFLITRIMMKKINITGANRSVMPARYMKTKDSLYLP